MDPTPQTATDTARLQSIAINQLKPNPWNRTVFDPGAMKDLVASLKAVGVKEPLIVRPLTEGGFQIASGHRRWLAAKEAGLNEVPCYVQPLPDDQVAEDNITINIQRENIPPLELARMVHEYINQFKKTQLEAASSTGKGQPWVSELTSFLTLPPEVLENIKALILGWIPLRAMKAAPKEVQLQVSQELKSGSLKPENVQKRCLELAGGKKKAKPTKSNAPTSAPDPLSGLWAQLHQDGRLGGPTSWQVTYAGSYHWDMRFGALGADLADGPAGLQTEIVKWLEKLTQAIRECGPQMNQPHKGMDALIPSNKEEIKRAMEESRNMIVPKNPQEWAQLEAIAPQGPAAICSWALGEGSVMAQKAKSLSWADLGETDPVAGCHKLLECFQGAST